ncbi:TetR/AcrR family transcriptional regulator [Kocuria himachalensis]
MTHQEGVRARRRREIEKAVVTTGRRMLGQFGPGGLSMRAVARELGMASSAIHRYYPTREDLLTALLLTDYQELAAALGAVDPGTGTGWERLTELLSGLRGWALTHPHDWALLYGTPVTGYVAPAETITAAEQVYTPFLNIAVDALAEGARPVLALPVTDPDLARLHPENPAAAAVALLWCDLAVGSTSLEVFGHYRHVVDPAVWVATTAAACAALAGVPTPPTTTRHP